MPRCRALSWCLSLLITSCTGLKDDGSGSADASPDAAPAGSGGASGQDGGPRCTPRASSACFEQHVHWFDSCGERGELREACANGCRGSACSVCSDCPDGSGSGGGGAGGAGGSGLGGSAGSGGTAGGEPPAPLPDGAECATGDQCTSTFCVAERCSTPASCEPALCDGGRACTAADSCECPAGSYVDGACCGDGIAQTREDCDDGASNSDSAPNACRTGCARASCGDGVVDNGESCDRGAQNSDTAVDGCRTSCAPASCGDGVTDTGESCDDDNTTAGDGCSTACKPEVIAIGAGSGTTCALFSDGRLKCWGSDPFGALGVDATLYGNHDAMLGNAAGEMGSALPTVLVGVKAFSTSASTVCAVSSEQVYCWGDNLNGFIRGSPTSAVLAPVRIDVGAPVKSVAVGAEHVCVLTTSDAVRCWGNNTDGQLATGNATPIYPVSGVAAATAINLGGAVKTLHSGGKRSCAVLMNDTLKCWGANYHGALGIGSTAAAWGLLAGETNPPTVSFTGGFVLQQVGLGGDHGCAVSTLGKARCWGDNEYGKLGIGSTVATNVPSADLLLIGAVQLIDASSSSTLALMSSGKVRVWGAPGEGHFHGRPGVVNAVGNNPGEIEVLQDIDLGTGVLARAVTDGGDFVCALTTDARIKCWGSNASGQLGHGSTQPRGGVAGDMGDNLPYTLLE